MDHIDVACMKLVAKEIAPCLTHITNISVGTNTFPSSFKHAKVVPLLKSQEKSQLACSPYRPVSLLPVLSRVVEKALFTQLSDYLEKNNLLHPNHHGGRKNHNTTTALIQLHDEWLAAAEEGMMTGVMMTDLSACFDLWDHGIGLEKAKLLGLEPDACAWVASYVSGRSQSCSVDGYLSSALKLPAYSVPQGSVGAPLLFLMGNTDLPDVIHSHPVLYEEPTGHCNKDGDSIHFVDDSTITYASDDPAAISDKLSAHYRDISDYMAANKFVINADKTHLLVMAPRRLAARRGEVQLKAGNFTIKPSESQKLLGVTIHQSMSWNQQIRDGKESVLKQLTSRVNGLRKLAPRASFTTKLMIANGIVISKLSYGIAVWGSCQGYLRKALQVQQLTAARAVCGYRSYFWSTSKLLTKCGWLSVNQLYWQQVLTTAHKAKVTKKPVNIHSRMMPHHNHGTRAAGGVSRGFGGHPARASFNYAAGEYNRLPEEIKSESIYPVFKRKLKAWVLKNIPI